MLRQTLRFRCLIAEKQKGASLSHNDLSVHFPSDSRPRSQLARQQLGRIMPALLESEGEKARSPFLT